MWITLGARYSIASISIICVLVFAGCSNISDGPVAEAEIASVAPVPAVTEELTNVIDLGDDHLTFEIPRSWNAEFEDLTAAIKADGTAPEFNGHSAQRAIITNPDATVHVDVFTNVPWPDTVAVDPDEVELLYAEPLDMGYEPSDEGYGMWLRVVIGENPDLSNSRPTFGAYDERFEDDRYMLIVAPYFAKHDLSPPDEIGGGLTAFRFPFTEYSAGAWWDESITIAAGTIRQSAAEELTGAEGLDAMRQVVETEEFEQLFDVIKSFRVHVDTGAPPKLGAHASVSSDVQLDGLGPLTWAIRQTLEQSKPTVRHHPRSSAGPALKVRHAESPAGRNPRPNHAQCSRHRGYPTSTPVAAAPSTPRTGMCGGSLPVSLERISISQGAKYPGDRIRAQKSRFIPTGTNREGRINVATTGLKP